MKTLLQGVNALLKKTEQLDADGELEGLTDSARQVWIDGAVQALNETVDELYDLPAAPMRPNQMSEATITLATSDQDYPLRADLVRLIDSFGLVNEANNHIINIDATADAYRKLVLGDLDQDDTGLASVAAIRPTDGQLWLDRAPTANENGRVYKYRYEKDMGLENAGDLFPFTDPVYRAVIEAATEKYMKIKAREYNRRTYLAALARAASRLSQFPRRESWGRNSAAGHPTDPLSD